MGAGKIGKMDPRKGQAWEVHWDSETGAVCVTDYSGFFAQGVKRRCGARAKTAGEAVHIAEAMFIRAALAREEGGE